MDIWTKEKRSEVMSHIRSKDTKPELIVRSLLHGMGFRFRLHRKGLPGRPDIVLPRYTAVIFVHGCFWHQHAGCKNSRLPKTNSEKWKAKLDGNVERDKQNIVELHRLGWKTLVIWECEVEKHLDDVQQEILNFLKHDTTN